MANESTFEIPIDIPGNKYGDVAILESYNGTYSLVAGRKSKNGGTVYKNWGFPQDKDKQPREKAIPWKVPLGDAEGAKAVLQQALAALGVGTPPEHEPAEKYRDNVPSITYIDDDSDIPF